MSDNPLPATDRPVARARAMPGPGRAIRAARTPRTLHDSVVDQLRDQIVTGAFAIGDRLADAALAEQFGVSRTPIREALKVLAAEGLVMLIPRKGARVAGMTSRQLAELFEVIAGLERQAVELATRRMTRREHARLRALHDRMARHFAGHEREPYFSANHDIHLLLVSLSGNAVLRETHAGLIAKARRERFMALQLGGRWAEAMAEHESLMAAIADGHAAAAGEIMARHVRRTGELVCAAFADRIAA